MSDNSESLALGTILEERYEIVKKIGGSYCGAVYQAKDILNYDNLVALRVLNESKYTISGLQKQIKYLLENGEQLLSLHHFNIAPIYNYELFAEQKFIVNECLLGYTLADLIEEDSSKSLDLEIKCKLFRDICFCIDYLQSNGVNHHRLTPSNVFLIKKGLEYTPKIVGHEFALITDNDVLERSNAHRVYYPQRDLKNRVIYALGRILYEIMTCDKSGEINEKALPNTSKVSDISIHDIVMKCLESDGYRKYDNISDIIRDLDFVFPGQFDVTSKKSNKEDNICQHCRFPNTSKAKYCAQCNTNLINICPECSNLFPLSSDECPRCKTNLRIFYKFISIIQKMKEGVINKDPDSIYDAYKQLPEDVEFIGDKSKKLKSVAETLKKITDDNVSKAQQLKETAKVFLEANDYSSAMECVDAFCNLVSTDEFMNQQASELVLKIEKQAFEKAQEKAQPFIDNKEYLIAVGIYQEFLREHPFGSYSHKANKIIKDELLELYNGQELLTLYSEILVLIDERKFKEARNKGERLFKVFNKVKDKDALIADKKVTANDLKVKATKKLKDLNTQEIKEKKKQRLLFIIGFVVSFLIFCSGIAFFVFLKIQARESYEKCMRNAAQYFDQEDFDEATKSYQSALSIWGYSNDKDAMYGIKNSSAMLVFSEVIRNARAHLDILRAKVKSDNEYLVSKYYSIGVNELDQLKKSPIFPFLPESEQEALRNIRKTMFNVKLNYWRNRVLKRQWVLQDLGIKFVKVKIGEDLSNKKEDNAQLLTNKISESYIWCSECEINQEQFKKIMGYDPSYFKSLRQDRPVEMVSWNEAVKFCRLLTERERRNAQLTNDLEYRLPTDKEWEFLCRAGVKTPFNTGDTITSSQAKFSSNDLLKTKTKFVRGTVKVGTYKPNNWGLYDMHGNVAEWCLNSPSDNNGVVKNKNLKIICGGGWFDTKNELRADYRDSSEKASKSDNVGFRIVLAKRIKQ